MSLTPSSSIAPSTVLIGGTVAVTQSTSPWVVDGSAVVQPVSGTVTANQGTAGAAAWPISAASLPLPTGAATDASLTNGNLRGSVKMLDSGGVNVASVSAAGAVKVDGSAVTQPVSGTVAVSGVGGTVAVSASSLPLPTGAATDATLQKVQRAVDEAALNDLVLADTVAAS